MASKNVKTGQSRRATKRRSQWYREPKNWLVVAMLAFAVAVVAFKLGFHVHPTIDIDRAAIATAELSYPSMKEIESLFVCPCGNCGELELEVCACDGPGGAMEMKTVIARMLRSGSSVDEVVATVSAEYGGLKQTSVQDGILSEEETPDGSTTEPPTEVFLQTAHGKGADPNELLTVVSAFDCPCGNCALTLLDCTCDHARGAVEVKAFVRAKLESGLSPDQVIDEVDQSYGGRRYSNAVTVVTEGILNE